MAVRNVPPLRGVAQIAALLDSPEIMGLISDLQETRWTGRPGYPIRAMVGLALVKAVYALPTWSRTVRLVAEHAALQDVLGVAPSADAAYRFAVELRKHGEMLTACLDRVLAELREVLPELGGFTPGTCVLDKEYDGSGMYAACESRDIRPVIPLKLTVNVVNGKHKPPSCPHGVWTSAGSDAKRGASKWRCPTRECQPASVWIKADRLHTLIPRTTDRWKALYRTRGAVERGYGRLKHEWGMLPLRVRRLPRVRLHVDLTILAHLACALATARAVPLAA